MAANIPMTRRGGHRTPLVAIEAGSPRLEVGHGASFRDDAAGVVAGWGASRRRPGPSINAGSRGIEADDGVSILGTF